MTSHKAYGHSTTATEVAKAFSNEIQGKVILITGASLGTIGDATARAIAQGQPKLLILSGRSQTKLDDISDELRKEYPSVPTRTLLMDLSSQKSVRQAADEVNGYSENIHVLINNAGAMGLPTRQLSVDGIEMHFASNHVGHMLFTNLILPKLKAAAEQPGTPRGSVRIINVSSRGHMYSPIRFSDYNCDHGSELPPEEEPDWEKLKWRGEKVDKNGYGRMIAYGQSKTANVLFSVALKQRLLASAGIQSFSLHPGGVLSVGGAPAIAELDPKIISKMKNIDEGASTTMVAAFDPAINDAKDVFLDDCQFSDVREWATDPGLADRLWELSEKLVGESFRP